MTGTLAAFAAALVLTALVLLLVQTAARLRKAEVRERDARDSRRPGD